MVLLRQLRDDPVERDIAELQKQADQLGEEGKLEEFNEMTRRIEELKQRKMQEQVRSNNNNRVFYLIIMITIRSRESIALTRFVRH
jgi:hypothetical protein